MHQKNIFMVIFTILIFSSYFLWADQDVNNQKSESEGKILALRRQITDHRQRAMGYARMAEFDEALIELTTAETRALELEILIFENTKKNIHTYQMKDSEQISLLIESIKIRKETYNQTIKRFGLTSEIFSDFIVMPVVLIERKFCCLVIYTMRPNGLKKEQIAIDPKSYQSVTHIHGSRSYIKMFSSENKGFNIWDRSYTLEQTYEVPEGYTPLYCEPSYSQSYDTAVILVGASNPTAKDDLQGVMVFTQGLLKELKGGMSNGPAIIISGKSDSHVHSIVDRYALQRSEKNISYVSNYSYGECHEIAQFEGNKIVKFFKLQNNKNELVQILIPDQNISKNRFRAIEISRIYLIRSLMEDFFYLGEGTFPIQAESFDEKLKQWTITYDCSSKPTIVLDEFGHLVSSQNLKPLK